MKRQFKWAIFAVCVLAVILAFFIQHAVINTILILAALLFVSLGWYIINPEDGMRFDLIFFILGYSISTSLVGFLFTAKDYPLADMFMYVATGELLLSLVLLAILHKKKWQPMLWCAVFLVLSLIGIIV